MNPPVVLAVSDAVLAWLIVVGVIIVISGGWLLSHRLGDQVRDADEAWSETRHDTNRSDTRRRLTTHQAGESERP